MRELRIAFTGPSGSGKTTLVKKVKDLYNLQWLNGSSGEIKTSKQNLFLEASGLSVGKGHREVIRSGHIHPEVAIANQNLILKQRAKLFEQYKQKGINFVTDRSTIDNIVYYLLQCSMYQTEQESFEFIQTCLYGTNSLTHIIYVPTMIPIENNGSRVDNIYFQETVNCIFRHSIELTKPMMVDNNCKFLEITELSIDDRMGEIEQFLKNTI